MPEDIPQTLIINGLSGETGEIVWSYPFIRQRWSVSYVRNLVAAENGDLIGMGYIDELPEPNPLPETNGLLLIGWIFRMSADGELKWQRYIYDDRSPLYFPSLFYNATELPNGDLAFVGVYEDTFPNQDPFINDPNVWLVRTDSNGCLTPNCGDLQIVTDTGIITSTWEEFLSVKGAATLPFSPTQQRRGLERRMAPRHQCPTDLVQYAGPSATAGRAAAGHQPRLCAKPAGRCIHNAGA